MKNKAGMQINVQNKCYAMASVDGITAEITMYGEIVDARPVDWWTGKEIEGSFIILSEFLEDLKAIENCKNITVRMDSIGGDAGVSITIHNRFRELIKNGINAVCVVDGCAMSGGSLIMSAFDDVKVNPSSLVMIHQSACKVFGYFNACELKEQAKVNEAYDKAQVSIYQRKTKLGEDEILSLMKATTYMTGREAVEKGFADELVDSEPLEIAAAADRKSLYVKGRQLRLYPGMELPKNIPVVKSAVVAAVDNKIKKSAKADSHDEGGLLMAEVVKTPQVNTEGNGEPAAQNADDVIAAAVSAERRRIQEIDEISALFDSELVASAKFGKDACNAQELAYRAAQKAAKNGKTFLTNLTDDAKASNTASVSAVPKVDAEEANTPEARLENARALVHGLFNNKEEK